MFTVLDLRRVPRSRIVLRGNQCNITLTFPLPTPININGPALANPLKLAVIRAGVIPTVSSQ